MTLRDEMWKIFCSTGNINAYLYYKESFKYKGIDNNTINRKEKVLQGI